MRSCAFCRIINGEIAATPIFQDDHVLCIMDIAPVTVGHAVLMTRKHYHSVTTVPGDTLARLMTAAPAIAQAIVRSVDGDGFNLHLANGQCAGQAVPHVHVHIIPRSPIDGFCWGWRTLPPPDSADSADILEKIRRRLDKTMNL